MSRNFAQDRARLKQYDSIQSNLDQLDNVAAIIKQIGMQLAVAKQRVQDGIVNDDFDQADLDKLNVLIPKVTAFVTAATMYIA